MNAHHPADMTAEEYRAQVQARIEFVRVAEGRCRNCGVFDGPTHRCPTVPVRLLGWHDHGPQEPCHDNCPDASV